MAAAELAKTTSPASPSVWSRAARLDLRVTFRPRWMNDRWQIHGEVVNLLNRDNTSSLNVHLVYAPRSDRPRITETNGEALPLLPAFGLRCRF